MAHKKTGSSGVSQGVNVAGKRRGVKVYGGQLVKAGGIIVRQKGTKFFPGENSKMGRDFTIYSTIEGYVNFRNIPNKRKKRKAVDVIPAKSSKL